MGVERDQPDVFKRQSEPDARPAGSPHYCRRPAGSARAARRSPAPRRGSAPSPARCDRPAIGTSPWSAIGRRKLAPGLDVIAPDPPQRRAQQRRRQVATARRHRSRRKRRADQPDRRCRLVDRREARRDWASRSFFDPSSRARLRANPCGTACSSTAMSRPWSRRRQSARRPRTAAIGITGRPHRPRRQAHRARRIPRQGSGSARRRLGHAGPRRLPHASGFRRHPRRRACDAPRRRDL